MRSKAAAEPRGWHPAGAPFGGCLQRPVVGLDSPDRPARVLDGQVGIVEQLSEELLMRFDVDPRGSEPRLDLLVGQLRRQHPLKRGDVDHQLRARSGDRGPSRA